MTRPDGVSWIRRLSTVTAVGALYAPVLAVGHASGRVYAAGVSHRSTGRPEPLWWSGN